MCQFVAVRAVQSVSRQDATYQFVGASDACASAAKNEDGPPAGWRCSSSIFIGAVATASASRARNSCSIMSTISAAEISGGSLVPSPDDEEVRAVPHIRSNAPSRSDLAAANVGGWRLPAPSATTGLSARADVLSIDQAPTPPARTVTDPAAPARAQVRKGLFPKVRAGRYLSCITWAIAIAR